MIDIAIEKDLDGGHKPHKLTIELKIEMGSFVAVSGPSGSGKTTFLRTLAGLEEAKGTIYVDGEAWLTPKQMLAPHKRSIGFVFQDYALFPNMSVYHNLLYVQRDHKLAEELLAMTELSELKSRMPHTLSGGQQQRVALCRAMMKRPKLLLMDEPLSALDPAMRSKLQKEILDLHKKFGTTTLMVSHDPSEIYRLANRNIVLEAGRLVNDGSPKEVLLKTQGSQKFSFRGELIDILHVDVICVAVVAIGQQLVEVVISKQEAQTLRIGQTVNVGTKAFAPIINR